MSLIAWLPLNESTIKETILNRPITAAGSLQLPSYGVANTTYDKRPESEKVGWFGKIGPGYTFNNSGIHMTNISITKTMSFSLWARLSSDCKKCHILDFRDILGNGIQPIYYGYEEKSEKYGIQIYSNWGGSEYVPVELHDDQWHHIVVTMEDGQKACLYIDGALWGKTDTNMTMQEKDDAYVRIGCRLNEQNPIAGMIQDVRIYNHSLSSREAKELSQALVLHYNFENLGIQQNYFNVNEYIKATAKNNCEVSAYGTNGFVFKSTGNDPYVGTSTHSGDGVGTNITYPILTSTTTQVCISWTHVSGTLELNKNYLTSLNENGQALNTDHINFGNGTKIGNRRYAIVNLPIGTKKIHVRFGNEDLGSGGMIIVDQVSVREGNSYEFIPPSAAQLPSNNTGLYSTYACANLGVSDDAAQGKYAGKLKDTIIQCPFNSNGWEEFTMASWVKLDSNFTSLSGSTACIIVGGIYLCIESDKAFSTWCYGKNPSGYHTSKDIKLENNKWYHIATVWSKNDVKFYINGNLIEDATVSSTGYAYTMSGYANDFHQKKDIGAEDTRTNRMFNGLLDDVRIYATALSAEEIYRLAHTKQAIDNKGNEYCSNFTETNTTTSTISSKSIHKLNGLSETIQLDDGSYWIQVLHHNNRGNKVHFPFSAAEDNDPVVVNSDGTRHNNNDKSQFCHNLVYVSEDCWSAFPLIAPWTNNNWEFMYIENQGITDNILVRRWSQTIDPFLAKWEDVTPDSAKVTTISNMPDKRGMYKYHNTNNNGYTYFCIANTSSSNWFGAIGSWHEAANGIGHGVGIPNMLDSTSGITDLYVRVDPTKITYKEFKNGIIMPNTINEF